MWCGGKNPLHRSLRFSVSAVVVNVGEELLLGFGDCLHPVVARQTDTVRTCYRPSALRGSDVLLLLLLLHPSLPLPRSCEQVFLFCRKLSPSIGTPAAGWPVVVNHLALLPRGCHVSTQRGRWVCVSARDLCRRGACFYRGF